MHEQTITPAAGTNPADVFGDGGVGACGGGDGTVTYNGRAFATVEAARHAAWHAKAGQ